MGGVHLQNKTDEPSKTVNALRVVSAARDLEFQMCCNSSTDYQGQNHHQSESPYNRRHLMRRFHLTIVFFRYVFGPSSGD
jgi:hypothetical protein